MRRFDQCIRLIGLAMADPRALDQIAAEVRVIKFTRLLKLGKLKDVRSRAAIQCLRCCGSAVRSSITLFMNTVLQMIDPQRLSNMLGRALKPLGVHGVELSAMFYVRSPPALQAGRRVCFGASPSFVH